jgi:transcriptional regulator with XRE-family HTH domain
MNHQHTAGELLRTWRKRRHFSQLDLAAEADVSQRHLSFIESGRAAPSRDMLVHLAERLRIPLRERNALLVAAGFAPVYRERRLEEPGFEAARRVIELILKGHEPYPALAVDRHWNLLLANESVYRLLTGIAPMLLEPPVNVLRLSLHPDGLAPRIANFRDWRGHVLARLAQQADNAADRGLVGLMDELERYPVPFDAKPPGPSRDAELLGLAVPLELTADCGVLSFLSTTTVFGTPNDISLAELAIESFFPANAETAAALAQAADSD